MPVDTVSDEDWVILLLKLLGSERGPWQPSQAGLGHSSSIDQLRKQAAARNRERRFIQCEHTERGHDAPVTVSPAPHRSS